MKDMKYKGYVAQIMEARKLTGAGTFGLPPGAALDVYPSDVFKSYPDNWMKGPGVFVVPVKADKGLWFNWRNNSEINTAVIPTVKGCNPITGMQTSGFHLEKYEKKCPKHGCDFLSDLFCPECDYKWPDRNYVSMSPLWWDGFRCNDGTVRQFFFSEDELRDVASAMIGKENTVPAFGFAFYSPKVPRQEETKRVVIGDAYPSWLDTPLACSCCPSSTSSSTFTSGNNFYTPSLNEDFLHTPSKISALKANSKRSIKIFKQSYALGTVEGNAEVFKGGLGVQNNINVLSDLDHGMSYRAVEPIKEVSIGAGAKIAQSLPKDSYALDTWKDIPDATMTIYFVFQEKLEELIAGGLVDLKGSEEGMLTGIKYV